ncbi:hypothetical protein Vdis_2074 [Vulcanisaeta distributa DSM 14429]|uniref:DUF1634 domain-containing protein n=1 Tax=Vulcanisaeta distributa (strain DSM 14429 / JCM 11212 / NBRC 100878 / IC-017) TaxID=572478 RepID=E1QPF6_VULDI|nr:hypothetical protein Vdis_2074 [Vulcanisaeta distributa DSM 14429]
MSRTYGKIAFWIAIVGVIIAFMGLLLTVTKYYGSTVCIINRMLSGEAPNVIQLCMQNGIRIMNIISHAQNSSYAIILQDIGFLLFGIAAIMGILATVIMLYTGRKTNFALIASLIMIVLILSALGLISISM